MCTNSILLEFSVREKMGACNNLISLYSKNYFKLSNILTQGLVFDQTVTFIS